MASTSVASAPDSSKATRFAETSTAAAASGIVGLGRAEDEPLVGPEPEHGGAVDLGGRVRLGREARLRLAADGDLRRGRELKSGRPSRRVPSLS